MTACSTYLLAHSHDDCVRMWYLAFRPGVYLRSYVTYSIILCAVFRVWLVRALNRHLVSSV